MMSPPPTPDRGGGFCPARSEGDSSLSVARIYLSPGLILIPYTYMASNPRTVALALAAPLELSVQVLPSPLCFAVVLCTIAYMGVPPEELSPWVLGFYLGTAWFLTMLVKLRDRSMRRAERLAAQWCVVSDKPREIDIGLAFWVTGLSLTSLLYLGVLVLATQVIPHAGRNPLTTLLTVFPCVGLTLGAVAQVVRAMAARLDAQAAYMTNCAGVEKETFRLAGQRPRPGWGPASAWRRIALIPWLTLDGPTEEDGGNGEILLEPDDPESYVS